jgi:hypothetical protein
MTFGFPIVPTASWMVPAVKLLVCKAPQYQR